MKIGNLGRILCIFLMTGALSGCSVFMALHGEEDANLSVLSVGQDRGIVVLNLGEPDKTYIKDGIRVDIHQVQKGNAPSTGRALGHAAMDVLTFGYWEIIGTPVEGFRGKTYTITIEYDEDDKLVSVNTVGGHIKKDKKKKAEVVEEVTAEPEAPNTNFGD